MLTASEARSQAEENARLPRDRYAYTYTKVDHAIQMAVRRGDTRCTLASVLEEWEYDENYLKPVIEYYEGLGYKVHILSDRSPYFTWSD